VLFHSPHPQNKNLSETRVEAINSNRIRRSEKSRLFESVDIITLEPIIPRKFSFLSLFNSQLPIECHISEKMLT
jgi:hypothetical protein